METRANFVLIGTFVFMAIAALVLFAVWISKVQFNRDEAVYDVVMEGPVNGLSEGGEVRFNGIKVGEITKLGLEETNPKNVVARIRIDAKTPVSQDSNASVGFMGITGMTFIQLRAGDPNRLLPKRANWDKPPRIIAEKDQLAAIVDKSQNAIATAGVTLQRLNAVLSDENIASLSGILANINTITEQASREGGLIDKAEAAFVSMDRAGKSVNAAALSTDETVKRFDARFAVITSDTQAMMAQAQAALTSADTAFDTLDGAMAGVDSDVVPELQRVLSEFATAAHDMRILVSRMNVIAEDLERDPREFVFGDVKPYEGR